MASKDAKADKAKVASALNDTGKEDDAAIRESALLDGEDDEVNKHGRLAWVRPALFATFRDLNSSPGVSRPLIVICWFIDLIQMLVMPLSPRASMPWRGSPMMFNSVFLFTLPLTLVPGTDHPAIAAYSVSGLFIAAAVYTVVTAGLLLWTMLAHAGLSQYTPRWRVSLLRSLLWFGLHLVSVPVLSSLLSPFACASPERQWFGLTKCVAGDHLGYMVGSIVLLPLALALFTLTATLMINRAPDAKRNPMGITSTGRPIGLVLLIKTVLIMFFVVVGGIEPSLSGFAHVIVNIVGGLLWSAVIVYQLPYHTMWLNKLQAAFAAVFTISAVAALVGLVAGSVVAGPAWALALLPSASMGWFMCSSRLKSFADSTEFGSPVLVELRSRYLLSEANRAGHLRFGRHAAQADKSDFSLFQMEDTTDAAASNGPDDSDRMTARTGSTGKSGGTKNSSSKKSGSNGSSSNSGSSGQRNRRGSVAKNGASDYEKEAHALKSQMPPAVRNCAQLFQDGLAAFSASAMMELFAASFHGFVRGNKHLQRVHLRQTETKADSSALDIQFFAWSGLMDLKDESTKTQGNRLTVDRRVQFEGLLGTSRIQVQKLRTLVLQFWTLLAERVPNLAQLQVVGLDINTTMTATESTFKQLLELCPTSASVMRSYAEFLLELKNDPKRAGELLSDAELIEDEQSRALSNHGETEVLFGTVCDFDLSGESLALIKVSSRPGEMGLISGMNKEGLKLFGISRREAIGRDINTVIPEPVSSIHGQLLDRYMDTGIEVMQNTSRITFALHRTGHVFPMKLAMRAASTGNDWVAVAEEMLTTQLFVLFTGASTGWRVTGVCKSAQSMLGIDLATLRAGAVTLSSYLSDVTGTVQLLTSRDGAVVTLRNVSTSDGTTKRSSGGKSTEKGFGSTVPVTAKLQVIHLPFIGTPMYVLRYKRASAQDQDTERALRRIEDEAVDSGEESPRGLENNNDDDDGDVLSDGVEQSGSGSAGSEEEPFNALKHPAAPSQPVQHVHVREAQRKVHTPPLPCAVAAEPRLGRTHTPPPQQLSLRERKLTSTGPLLAGPKRVAFMHRADSSHSSSPHHQRLESGYNGSDDGSELHGSANLVPGKPATTVDNDSPAEDCVSSSSVPVHGDGNDNTEAENVSANADVSNAGNSYGAVRGSPPTALISRQGFSQRSQLRQRHPASGSGSGGALNTITTTTTVSASSTRGSPVRITMEPGDAIDPPHPETYALSKKVDSYHEITMAVHAPIICKSSKGPDVPDGGSAIGGGRAGSVPGRAGSVHSKGSARHSGTSATSFTEILRRGIVTRSTRMEGSLFALRRAIISVFVLVAIANVASLIVSTVLFRSLLSNFELVYENGQRGLYTQRVYTQIQLQVLSAQGKFHMSNTTRASSYAKIWSGLDDIAVMHEHLYLAVDGTVPEEVELYTNNSIEVLDLVLETFIDRGHFNVTVRYINLANLALEFIARARQFYWMDNADAANEGEPNTFWLLQNGFQTVRHSFNRSMMLSDTRSATQSDTIQTANLYVMMAVVFILAIVAIGVMVPTALGVSATKQAIFDVFLCVPVEIIRALRTRLATRILALRRAQEDADAGLDIAGAGGDAIDDDEVERQFKLGAPGVAGSTADSSHASTSLKAADDELARAINTCRNRSNSAAFTDLDDESDSSSRGCCRWGHSHSDAKVAPKPGGKAAMGRHFGRQTSARSAILLSMLWPVAAYMAYFGATYYWKQTVVDYSRHARAETLWSKQLEFYSPQAAYAMRNALSYESIPFVKHALNRWNHNYVFLNMLVDSLNYGDESRMLRPGLQVSPPTFEVMMRDGCYENDGYFYTMEGCRVHFMHGLLNDGLSVGIKQYLSLLKTAYDARTLQVRAAEAAGNQTVPIVSIERGKPYLIHELGLDYLAGALRRHSRIRQAEAEHAILSFTTQNIVVTLAAVSALGLIYIFAYNPMIRKLDKEIKQVRELLLLFPDSVARSVPAIINHGREMLASRSGGSVVGSAS